MQTEKMFRRALSSLGGQKRARETVGGRWVLVPPSRDYPEFTPHSSGHKTTAAERRRRNLTVLAGFIIVTFLLGLIPSLRFLLYANLVADILLIAYLAAAVYVSSRPAGSPQPRPEPASVEPLAETTSEVVGAQW